MTFAAWMITAVAALPMAVVTIECFAALLPRRRRSSDGRRPAAAVVVPAHNEQEVLRPTLLDLQQQLGPEDRLVVVADNCSDNTASIARDAGAHVVERSDDGARGKGYALAAGVAALDSDASEEVVVFVDADCRLSDGSLNELVRVAAATGRPAQGVYLMNPPPEADMRGLISSFAFLVKNGVRPVGLCRLGLPVLLTGSGMAVPLAIVGSARLASANIVEDLNIGLDYALAGRPPILCEQARIRPTLPRASAAAVSQRSRWEHGYLVTLLRRVPQLVWVAFMRLRPPLLAIALDLCVPPLSLVAIGCGAAWLLVLALGMLSGDLWPLLVLSVMAAAFGLALFVAWARFARDLLPLSALIGIPAYLFWKLPIYLRFVLKGQPKQWIRTQRER